MIIAFKYKNSEVIEYEESDKNENQINRIRNPAPQLIDFGDN